MLEIDFVDKFTQNTAYLLCTVSSQILHDTIFDYKLEISEKLCVV